MSKAFTNEETPVDDDVDSIEAVPLPAGTRNYMTPGGFARLRRELDRLVSKERPELVATVAWAASNGDRRIRFLVQRLDRAEVVDPATPREEDAEPRVFFGATVTVANAAGEERTVSIVGIDEIDTARGYISWISPMARALLKAREGDTVSVRTPAGIEELDVVSVRYVPLATDER